MRTLRILAASLAVALVSLLAAPSAEALTITLFNGSSSITVTDGGAGDTSPVAGLVGASGTVGVFEFVVTAGVSDPITGSPSSPSMILSIEALTFAGGTLTVALSDDNFAGTGDIATAGLFTPAPLSLLGIPLATTSSATYATYYGASNTEFDFGTLLTFQAVNGVATGFLPSGVGPYSLTQVVNLTSSTGVSTAAATLTVPDGGLALSLLGFALVGVEGLRRRFNGR
jgi:hypothetical protein